MELGTFRECCKKLSVVMYVHHDGSLYHVYLVRRLIQNVLCQRDEIAGYDRSDDLEDAMLGAFYRVEGAPLKLIAPGLQEGLRPLRRPPSPRASVPPTTAPDTPATPPRPGNRVRHG